MAKRKIRVGFDFDGVITYFPFRIIRHPVTLFKRVVLGQKRTKFFIPKTATQRWVWAILHEGSVLPAFGLPLVCKLISQGHIDAYLITGRFGYLEHVRGPQISTCLNDHSLPEIYGEGRRRWSAWLAQK